MALDPAACRLSEDDHQRIFDTRIRPRLFAGVAPFPAPVAVFFGGQPGSGKSAALDWAAGELAGRGGAVQIIGDDLREYHPANARLMREDDKIAAFYTGPDSGRWVEKAMAYAREQRFNVIIEGTMRDSNVVAATMKGFREAGYEIDARVLAVSFKLSEQGIYQRYEHQKATRDQGRMTTPEAHQAAYDGLPATVGRIEVEKLADRLTVYRRAGVPIYENELRDGERLRLPLASALIQAERARPMTVEEADAYREGYRVLAAMIRSPTRRATPEEIAKIDQLLAAAMPLETRIADYWAKVAAKGQSTAPSDTPSLTNDQSLNRPRRR
ncbi:MAG TPA: zeta toxin family protein [Devosiaceae bacterium]|nr:zeta toxin family protein [Devosiaceae bacterium]